MADVWVAEDRLLGRRVAVKILHDQFASSESFVERFRREAQSAANLAHHNIVAVHDWGEEGNTYFMVMELVEGRNLRDVLRNEGALLPRRVAEIGVEVATALNVAHNQGLVHRDIKPANVLLTPDGAVKVADFGIARAWDDSEQLTRTGAVIGTATYFSPEQAQGIPADARSDIYSLGVVMYELLTATPPFSGESPVAVAYQHVQQPPTPPSSIDPNIPPGLEAVVLKAMAKDPERRYQSAGELIEDLRRVLAGEVPLAAPDNEAPTRVVGAVMAADGGETRVARPAQQRMGTDPGYREPDRPDRSTMIIGILAAVALLGLGLILLFRLLGSGSSTSVEIPDLRGSTVEEARAALEARELRTTTENVTDAEIPVGLVAGTDPAAGTDVERGTEVTILVSAGAANVDVPRVIDLTEAEARTEIEAAGLEVGDVSTEASTTIAPGTVISQSPPPGERVARGTDVDLVVSAGSGALIVPDVREKSEADALFTLSQEGFSAAQVRVERRPHAEILEGFVIDTDPEAGQAVQQGAFVTVFVSEGAVPTVLPSVVGLEEQDARDILEELGFEVEVDEEPAELEFDDPLDGLVAEQAPEAGVTADFGTTVTLRIGEAEEGTRVPNFVGTRLEVAQQRADDAGLVLVIGDPIEVPFGSDQVDRVVEQDPEQGETVEPGGEVTVQFGEEGPGVIVPQVAGSKTSECMTEADARAAIEDAGLRVIVGQREVLDSPGHECHDKVVFQSPPGGQEVAEDSAVTIRLGENPTQLPDENDLYGFLLQEIRDMYGQYPDPTLDEDTGDVYLFLRWVSSGQCIDDPPPPYAGRIALTDPLPEEIVPRGTTVTVWYGENADGSCSAPGAS
jgi:serine/threonine-protein kinase